MLACDICLSHLCLRLKKTPQGKSLMKSNRVRWSCFQIARAEYTFGMSCVVHKAVLLKLHVVGVLITQFRPWLNKQYGKHWHFRSK